MIDPWLSLPEMRDEILGKKLQIHHVNNNVIYKHSQLL